MNSNGGRCHDNARCESMWARMKEEVFYSKNRKSQDYTISELKSMMKKILLIIIKYFAMSVCSISLMNLIGIVVYSN